ncbi:FKBP-type peptidyl-prolyl cis-trans isomerase, partial [Micromonospora echinospora]|uniref:FKBP-type peptidyl-prolyl cis-trans isomerase n=1 Tax=Micromonospora echinospora TaxID=1877 RepID=UPI0033F1CA92
MNKPEVGPIEGAPPADLVVEDITVGDGPEAERGQVVTVHYVGVAHSTGREFDASWNRGETFQFGLGAGQVIAGWDQGVAGMRVGAGTFLRRRHPARAPAVLRPARAAHRRPPAHPG